MKTAKRVIKRRTSGSALPLSTANHSSGTAPILFGGVPAMPSAEIFAAARKKNPLWYQLLEEGYVQFAQMPEHKGIYPDPTKDRGATLEQVWLYQTVITGVESYCVLARDMPDDQIRGIRRLQRVSPKKLVKMLQKLQACCGFVGAPTCYHDGKTAHCIAVFTYDQQRDRFVYHDGWPTNSLLCKENNDAGIDAQPEPKRLWSITSEEFERVVFASFHLPCEWARLHGVKFELFYDRWKKSDFFKFFHMKLVDERTKDGKKRRTFTAGPFKEVVRLIVDCRKDGKIVESRLSLSHKWMTQNLRIALDIAKSFVNAFAPPPDGALYEEVSVSLWELSPDALLALHEEQNGGPINQLLRAFIGARDDAELATDFARLSITNSPDETGGLLELAFSFW